MRTSYPTTPQPETNLPHPELDLTQTSTTEQSGNLLNMLMCQASSATKSPAATWLRLQSGLNGEGVEWNGGRSGVGSVLASYVQHPKWTTRSPLSHRVPEYQFRDGEGRCSVRLTPKVNFAFFAVGRCFCCISFFSFSALLCLVFLLCCCFYLILLPLLLLLLKLLLLFLLSNPTYFSVSRLLLLLGLLCILLCHSSSLPLWVIILYKMWGQWAYLPCLRVILWWWLKNF